MSDFLDSAIVQYLVLLVAIIAGIVALKSLSAYAPDTGPLGAVKRVILAA